jgi:hypothetical protein
LQSFENEINTQYKKWLAFAEKLTNQDRAVDVVNEVLEMLLTEKRERAEELSAKGEVDKYVCRCLINKAHDLRKADRFVELHGQIAEDGEDHTDNEDKMRMIESGLRGLTYGDRAIIQYELANIGTLKELSVEIGEDYEYLRQKSIRAKARLKLAIWRLQQ